MSVSAEPQTALVALGQTRGGYWLQIAFISVLVTASLSLYIRSAGFQFIEFDDQIYVFQNRHVLGGLSYHNIVWAMTSVVAGNWHPLTMLTFLCISSFFGPGPAAFHIVNVVLHTLCIALLYLFLLRSTGRPWPAFFAAALWGLHPLRVESVAWVSELKDVLCGAFWLGCMLAYLQYSRHRKSKAYWPVLLLHACALLAKPMAITLPFALLLLDFWPLGRNLPVSPSPGERVQEFDTDPKSAMWWWRDRLVEKLPLFLLSLIAARIAIKTQWLSSDRVFPRGIRISNALVSCVDYLRDSFFPRNLRLFYPHPAMLGHSIPLSVALSAALLLVVITMIAFWQRRTKPYLVTGWFWFLGTLMPVLGLTQAGMQARADRYTYVPAIGLTTAVVWAIAEFTRGNRLQQILAWGAGVAAAITLLIATAFTVGHWRDTATMFEYAVYKDPYNFLALGTLSDEARQAGHTDRAIALSRRAVEVAPLDASSRYSYGMALCDAGRLDEAVDQLKQAISIEPSFFYSFGGLGTVRHLQAGQAVLGHSPDEEKRLRALAIKNFRADLAWNRDDLDVAEMLGNELAMTGKVDEAIHIWQSILTSDPHFAVAHGDIAEALREKGNLTAAVVQYRAAIDDGSTNPDWETKLVYLSATNPNASLAALTHLLPIGKNAVDQTQSKAMDPLVAYGIILARVGRYDDAIAAANQAAAIASAEGRSSVAKSVESQISLYERGLPFVNEDR